MIRYLTVLATLFLAAMATVAVGQDDQEKDAKPEKFVVLMITGMDDSVSYEVVGKELEGAFKKDLDSQYKEALRSWNDRKKEANKSKAAFNESRPNRPKIKVVLKNATEEEARDFKKQAEGEKKAIKEEANTVGEGKSTDPNVKFSVVQIQDMTKSINIEIIEDSEVKGKKKSLDEEYKLSVKDWQAAKKEAKKDKGKTMPPKPSKPGFKVLKKGQKLDKAKEALAKAQEDLKKRTSAVTKKNKR